MAHIYVLFEKKPYLCGIRNKRYKVMMIAIVLKDSTYKRVLSRSRYAGCSVAFSSLPCRVFRDYGFTYLYFDSVSDMCYATDFLYACNAVYRVVETSL